MTDHDGKPLSLSQLAALESSLHHGSIHASEKLASWISRPSVVEIDSLELLPLEEATDVLPNGDKPICFCSMAISGVIAGEMIFAFDDASGMALADILLDQPPGTTVEWTELATSVALETTNILCCAYLNALSATLSGTREPTALVPAPPSFNREFAESLMEFALMGQAIAFDQVIFSKTRFEIDGVQVNWTLMFVPDAESMSRLPELLVGSEQDR